MINKLIIDESNSSYLVRPTLLKWIVTAYYHKPRKSKKGYVGSKFIQEDKKEFLPDYEANAIEMFEQYKTKYIKLLENKEIIEGCVNCYPVIKYYVTCSQCGKDAQIIDFLMLFSSDDGESMKICCEHCYPGKRDFIENQVGTCYDTSFFINKEELNWHKCINLQKIKWEDWENHLNNTTKDI